MKTEIIHILRLLFPFALGLVLWRMEHMFWNMGGILAMIPVFYCSFIRRIPWFSLFGLFICFLLDYNFTTHFYWTGMFCLAYAINGLQDWVDITRLEHNGLGAFMVFLGITILIYAITNFSISVLLKSLWCWVWATVLYIPTTILIQKVRK